MESQSTKSSSISNAGSGDSQKVSAQDVNHLYKQFRKAALESTARELRKQQYERIQSQIEILNVPIDNISVSDFLDQLKTGVVFTPNVDHLMKLQKDIDFANAYVKADYRICDSQILLFASKFLGTPIKAKISGSDLLPMFCGKPSGGYEESGVSRSTIGKGNNDGGACPSRAAR